MTPKRAQRSGGGRRQSLFPTYSFFSDSLPMNTAQASRVAQSGATTRALNPWTHIALPLGMLALGTFWFVILDMDRVLATWLYAWEGGRWAMKEGWWTEHVIHRGGRDLSVVASLMVIVATVMAFTTRRLHDIRWPLFKLFASVALSTGLVSMLKHHTGMDCPWDLAQYGGSKPYFGLFDVRPASIRASGCFPAGHASGGYAWVALYFFALAVKPQWKGRALCGALLVGLVFGISQQFRGAHFASHDLWTAAICWFVALGIYLIPGRRRRAVAPMRAE